MIWMNKVRLAQPLSMRREKVGLDATRGLIRVVYCSFATNMLSDSLYLQPVAGVSYPHCAAANTTTDAHVVRRCFYPA